MINITRALRNGGVDPILRALVYDPQNIWDPRTHACPRRDMQPRRRSMQVYVIGGGRAVQNFAVVKPMSIDQYLGT